MQSAVLDAAAQAGYTLKKRAVFFWEVFGEVDES
jgi:hypothetical protein